MSSTQGSADTQPLTVDERAELERLRALVAADGDSPPVAEGPGPTRRHPSRARWTGAVVLLLLAALLAPLSAVATWTRTALLDTDKYVTLVAPLAEDPAVQAEISGRITNAVFEALQVEERTATTLQAIGERPRVAGVTQNLPVELSTFAEPISTAIKNFTHDQVSTLVASDTFQDAWVTANRAAHDALVRALTGEGTATSVTVEGGRVTVNLAEFIAAIKPVLVERGVPFADRIPAVNAEIVVLDSPALAKGQSAVRLLDLLRVVLPVATILLLVAGVALAPSRRRALVLGASLLVGSLVLLLLGVQVLRALYLDDLEQVLLVPQVASVLFDAVTTPLRLGVRGLAVLFLVIAVGAWAAGPSGAAAAVRSVPARLAGATRRPTGAVATVSRFAHANTTGLRIAVGGLAVLALLAGDRPSAGEVLLIAVLVTVALIVIEVLSRWGAEAPEVAAVPAAPA
jgi:hypothetical protein